MWFEVVVCWERVSNSNGGFVDSKLAVDVSNEFFVRAKH